MQRHILWENPAVYTDGIPIDPVKLALIKVHIYKDGQEVYVSLPGVTEQVIEVTPGVTNSWELAAELDGQMSAKSVPFSYMEPFQIPTAPTNGHII